MKNMIVTSDGKHIPVSKISYIEVKEKFVNLHMNTGDTITINFTTLDEESKQIIETFDNYHEDKRKLLKG